MLIRKRFIPDAQTREAIRSADLAISTKQADVFEEGEPSARVVRLPYPNHVLFSSHEADVLREIRTFLGGLR